MKPVIYGLTAILLASGVAAADQEGRADFVPVVDGPEQPTSPVHRDTRGRSNFATVELVDAEPRQVDQDRNGKVSFQELLTFDF